MNMNPGVYSVRTVGNEATQLLHIKHIGPGALIAIDYIKPSITGK